MQGKPYAIFGTCLGAIVAYEIARAVEREKLAPLPVALFPAAVSPPHLYALAVTKLYLTRTLAANEAPPTEEVMEKLRGWDKLPKETLMLVRSHIDLISCPTSKCKMSFSTCTVSELKFL
jgi:surfactin synthase thioesterase subunit